MADAAAAHTTPDADAPAPSPGDGLLTLLRRPDFRRIYAAGLVSELGDAFQYIALMWARCCSAARSA
jgi:hypothetical protein